MVGPLDELSVSHPRARPLELDAAADGQPQRSRIHVAMTGSYSDPRYGRFTITSSDVDNWKRLLAEHFNGRVPIDEDHKTDKGISSEASGWIVGLDQQGDQVLADVEWTSKGKQAVLDKRFLYMSPTFVADLKDQQGKSLGPALLRAALTNSPFLHRMPAVQLTKEDPMTPDPIHPNRFEDGYERVRRDLKGRVTTLVNAGMDEASAILLASGFTKSDVVTPEAPDDPLYDEVMADSDQLDSHIRALMVDRQLGYVEALDWLQQTAERCWDVSGPLTLSAVLSRGGTTLSRIHTLMAADDERVRALSTEGSTPDQKVDDQGRVLLPADVDPDDLLADEKAPKKAFRRARELGVGSRYGDGGEPVGEGPGWEAFLQEWKVYTDKGWDLVETLRREQQGDDQALNAIERVGEAQRLEAKIVRDRADRQAAEAKRIDDAAEKLRRERK